MGYMHIPNLYKTTEILNFKECFTLEKAHGTSAHIGKKNNQITYFSGGMKQDLFMSTLDTLYIEEKLNELFPDMDITIYGEAYGGKQQGMSLTYGSEAKFIVFDVRIGDTWLNVPNAEDVTIKLGLEFVPYIKCDTNIEVLNYQRDLPSEIAKRRGCGDDKKREGIVIRPLIELMRSDGKRIIVKHKGDDFKETKSPREVDPEALQQLTDAKEIADEWVTEMRLSHVLDKMPELVGDMTIVREVITAMKEDVIREAGSEIIVNKFVIKQLSSSTAKLYKQYISKI